MDAKEAIKYFKFIVAMGRHYYPKDTAFDSFAAAIDALEKQVPKEVQDMDSYYFCPSCNNEITTQIFDEDTLQVKFAPFSFCPYCGQAIKNDKE